MLAHGVPRMFTRMSVLVWKDVLYPGRQRDKHGNWFTVSPRDTQAAARNCKRMIGRGVRVPCVWEHQPGADPVEMSRGDSLANYVKHTFGEIRDSRVDANNVLWLQHEVYSPTDASKLVETRMQVSPKVCPGWTDSKGGNYRGATIAHVAATPTPVQFWQKPFELSQGDALFLSYGEPAMEEDEDKKKAIPEEGDELEAPELEEPEILEGDAQGSGIKAVIQALRESGLNIPDEVSDWQHLVIAIKAGGQKGDDDLAPPPGDMAQAGGPPMMMSDGRTLQRERQLTKKELVADLRNYFATGKCTRKEGRDILREIQTVELSYYADGKMLPNKTALKVELIGEREPWSAWKPNGNTTVELSNAAIDHPPEKLTGADAAGVQEAKNAILSRIPGPKQ